MALFHRKRLQFEAVQAIAESDFVVDPVEGPIVHVDIGDWLVTIGDRAWPMKPGVFNELFEPV